MLAGIEVRNAVGTLVLTLPISVSIPEARYRVKDIDGLGPVKAEISTSSYASQDGGVLHAAKTGMRNIVLKLGYNVDYAANQTVEALRRDLYTYFPPKGEVTLRFLNQSYGTVEIKGIVETCDPVLFAKDPEVQISILCVDPRFTSLAPVIIDGFNNIAVNPVQVGMGGSGFLMELFINRSISQVTIVNLLTPDIVIEDAFLAGDVLRVSTARGKKYVDRFRGTNAGILNSLKSGSMAMMVDSRTTSFKVNVAGASDIPFRLTFTPNYLGV